MFFGYAITAAVYASFILMLAFIVLERKDIKALLSNNVDRYSLLGFAAILVFFLLFSIILVSPVEQLYFDENIYQGIALNILAHGNALWCQYGTGYLGNCYINSLYHDPVGWSAFIAIAFAIFGIGTGTAYNLELLAGALSILFVFLLSSVLIERKSFALVSTLAFAMMPQLFIWARTQADVDLPFMMFATLSFFLFVLFTRRKSLNSLAAFGFSLVLVTYMRIEAILLVPVFAVLIFAFGDRGVRDTITSRIGQMTYTLMSNTNALIVLLLVILLLLPQIYYISVEAENPAYGQGSTQSVVSLGNFQNNTHTNVLFLFGGLNGINFYPMAWHYAIVPLAIIGAVMFAFDRTRKNRFGTLLLLLLWFVIYILFYTAFYAGAATYGVDSRFMLSLLPASSLLAAFAIFECGEAVRTQNIWMAAIFAVGIGLIAGVEFLVLNSTLMAILAAVAIPDIVVFYILASGRGGDERWKEKMSAVVMASLAIWLLVYPFNSLVPVVAIAPQNMPQQTVILKAINAFYNSYNSVPQSCLVFSFTPDIWEEVGRASAQIDNLGGANQTVKSTYAQYSCFVIDYGYWCVVPPFHDSVCKYAVDKYKLRNLLPSSGPIGGSNVSFYQILNYSYS